VLKETKQIITALALKLSPCNTRWCRWKHAWHSKEAKVLFSMQESTCSPALHLKQNSWVT